MTDPVPSKERVTDTELRILIGDMEAWKPSQMSITQKWQLSAFHELQALRTALRGIQSCSTCEACRGAATLAIQGVKTKPAHEREPPHCSSCSCGMDPPHPEAIRALWNKAVITQDGKRATVAFETAEEAETAFDYIHQLGSIAQPPFVCLGGCGTSVPSPHAYCSACFLKARADQRSERPADGDSCIEPVPCVSHIALEKAEAALLVCAQYLSNLNSGNKQGFNAACIAIESYFEVPNVRDALTTPASPPADPPPSPIPFAGVAKGVSYEALANATYPERMYGGDATPPGDSQWLDRAIEALERCYDVTEWPAESGSFQLTVLNELREHRKGNASRCYCGTYEWQPGTVSIKDSRGRKHFMDALCDGVPETTEGGQK